MRSTNTLILEVDGREVTLDIEGDTSSNNIDEDMETIAPLIAWYGRLLASARRSVDEAEANYKHWKAIQSENIQAKHGGKLAEWKVRDSIEAMPDSVALRGIIARSWEVSTRLDTALQALKVKAEMLRSRGAMMRAELDTTAMVTRSEKVAAMKGALKSADR